MRRSFNCWYHHFELVISAIRIADITNSKCWYQQFELLRQRIVDINNSNYWYQHFELLISTIRIVDISNCEHAFPANFCTLSMVAGFWQLSLSIHLVVTMQRWQVTILCWRQDESHLSTLQEWIFVLYDHIVHFIAKFACNSTIVSTATTMNM